MPQEFVLIVLKDINFKMEFVFQTLITVLNTDMLMLKINGIILMSMDAKKYARNANLVTTLIKTITANFFQQIA